MNKVFAAIFFLVFSCTNILAQSDYNVVFDLTSADSANQLALIRQATVIKELNANARVEVVLYGQSLGLVLKDKSTHVPAIRKLLGMKDVAFKVCAVTMKRKNIEASELIEGVGVVPDGIYEIITRQKQGWGYIKVAQ